MKRFEVREEARKVASLETAAVEFERMVLHLAQQIAAEEQRTGVKNLEFRARDEVGGFGHSYVVLGTVDATGEMRETVVAGFMSKGADDDYWGQFGIPVTGTVGLVRLDFTRRPAARFRIVVSKVEYYRVVREIYHLSKTWTTYEVLLQNCNSFVGQIAASVGLRTPLVAAQFPVRYVTELRALNSR